MQRWKEGKIYAGGHNSYSNDRESNGMLVCQNPLILAQESCYIFRNSVSQLLNRAILKSKIIITYNEIFYTKNKGNNMQNSSLPNYILYLPMISVHVVIYI